MTPSMMPIEIKIICNNCQKPSPPGPSNGRIPQEFHSERFKEVKNPGENNSNCKCFGEERNKSSTQRNSKTRQGILKVVRELPTRIGKEIRNIKLPAHHDVRAKDVDKKRLGAVLATAYESDLHDFETLLLLKGAGPRTIQSLTLVSEVIYGTPTRFADPARFSFAHGGKDGHPFPVPTKVYDETISMLSNAVDRAKLDRSDKQHALRSLHETAKRIEKDFIPNDNFDKLIEKEWAESHLFGGRTVFDGGDQKTIYEKRKRKVRARNAQLSLFGDLVGIRKI